MYSADPTRETCAIDDGEKYTRPTRQHELLRGAIVNRTYGIHKNLYIHRFLPTIFGPIYYGPP